MSIIVEISCMNERTSEHLSPHTTFYKNKNKRETKIYTLLK